MNSEQSITDEVPRRRGRPAGKNRVPLSLQERRARNAQYERERRTETADAMRELAEAAGCDPNISNADLLATVITQLQMSSQRDSSDDLNELRRINNNLMLQIATIEERLKNEYPHNDIKIEQQDVAKPINKMKHERLPGKRCLPESSSDSDSQPEKIPKLEIMKTYNGHSTKFPSHVTSDIKTETIVNGREGSSRSGENSRSILIEPIANGISSHVEGSKTEFKAAQIDFNNTEQSSQQQGCQSVENKVCLPYIEQSNTHNQQQLQSHCNLDLLTDMEKGILAAWLDSDGIFNAEDQSEIVYERKWRSEDLLQKLTS